MGYFVRPGLRQRTNDAQKIKIAGSCLHGAVSIQGDVSFMFSQVFTYVIGHGVWLQDKPALRPVLPLVSFLHHVALHRERGGINPYLLPVQYVDKNPWFFFFLTILLLLFFYLFVSMCLQKLL